MYQTKDPPCDAKEKGRRLRTQILFQFLEDRARSVWQMQFQDGLYCLVKVPYDERITVVYCARHSFKEKPARFIHPEEDMTYAGFYNGETKQYYDGWYIADLFDVPEVQSLRDMEAQMYAELNQSIWIYIDTHREELCREVDPEYLRPEAIRVAARNETNTKRDKRLPSIEKPHASIEIRASWQHGLVLEYISNPTKFLKEKTEEYLVRRRTRIAERMVLSRLVDEELAVLEQQRSWRAALRRSIADAARGHRNVHAVIEKNGSQFCFTVKADTLLPLSGRYSTKGIAAKERDRFREEVGDFDETMIVSLRHGRSCIYERPPEERPSVLCGAPENHEMS